MNEPVDTHRTGPVGRAARAVLAAGLAASLVSILDEGGLARLREVSIRDEVGLMVLTVAMSILFVHLVAEVAYAVGDERQSKRWRAVAIVSLIGVLSAAALVGQLAFGRVWGLPLADLVWWFDVIMLMQTIVALALAVVLGTPGCEIGVWTQLIGQVGHPRWRAAHPVGCIAGLDLLDAWEARQIWPQQGRDA